MRRKAATLSALGAFLVAGTALAAAPVITTVGQRNRHPIVAFTAPRAGTVIVYVARTPDRATDGNFLVENVVDSDHLTESEIAVGSWLYERQLNPGRYFVILRAWPSDACESNPPPDYELTIDPDCADGFSNMVTVTVPKPRQTYRLRVEQSRYASSIGITLTVSPLGERLPYRLCWKGKGRRSLCVRSTVEGYDWNRAASDFISVSKRLLPTRARFEWYVRGRRVASKIVRVGRP